MGLEVYNQKRNFKETAEPEGKKSRKSKKLQFVVQRHAASRLHYDFRLEVDGVLKSWAVPKGPSLNPKDKRLAMMVEDHPFAYRTFEGTIPKGNYGAGEVEIWDKGYYEPLNKSKGKSLDKLMLEELEEGSLKVVLHGEKLKGEFALVKIKNGNQENAWLLIKHNDDHAVTKKYDAEKYTDKDSKVTAYLESKKKSKSTGKEKVILLPKASSSNGKERKLAETVVPMLCKIGEKPFDSKEWAFEIKWDGYRAIADLRNDKVQLYSRNGLDFSRKFPKIYNSLKLQSYEMVLDGEIVAYDAEGKPSFQRIQHLDEDDQQAVIFQVFDILWLNGHSTQDLTYLQRKELLSEALVANEVVQYHDFVLEHGKAFFKEAQRLGLEGIIAKKVDSYYSPKVRTSEWLKIKIEQTEEALICGFTEGKGSRTKFGSLVLGKYLDNELVFCGHVGTGFKEKDLNELHSQMLPLVRKTSPFPKVPKTNGKTTWLTPELVAEIKFTELTKDLIYRHPVFLHLREDKDKKEVYFSADDKLGDTKTSKAMKTQTTSSSTSKKDISKTIGSQKLKLTNQDKIYFPELEITKAEVIDYYQSMSKFILPHLKDRPQSLNRFPNGIHGMSFYQKDAAEATPDWIAREEVFSESTDKYIDYIVCNDKATLAYLNNLGCIEMNPWTSKTASLDKPSYLVLDLDPSDKNTFDDVIETAQMVKYILDQAKIKGYAKTSGSTGIHVYVPMNAKYAFDQVKDFGHVLMQMVQMKLPKLTTLERSLQKRDKNKIYLDYLQNRRGQTLASVYSLRPKKEASVSMPITWEELKTGMRPGDFNIYNALERVQDMGDIFKPVLGKGVDILKAIKNLEYAK